MDADLFRALADPTRRRLFESLCRQDGQSVAALTAGAGISQPAVSRHLRLLAAAGLVSGQVRGRETHYRAHPQALTPLSVWTRDMTAFWENRLDRLDDLVKRMDQ